MMLAHIDSQFIPSAEFYQEDCAWCWYAEHPHTPFPEQWSSTICLFHQDWQLARLAEKRKQARTVKTVGFVLVETETPQPLYFPYKPHTNRTCYPTNWSKVSWLLRKLAGNRCEWCGSSRKLTVHHMGSMFPTGKPGNRHDKHDLRRENLYVLCNLCHRAIEDWQEAQEQGIDYELILP